MTKIALTLIVKNEEKNIIQCLDSMTGLYDHAFITDTGSEDDTVALLKKRRDVTVSHFEWIEDFAAARNYNLSQVPEDYEWVVWADADDRVHATEDQRVEFRKRVGYMEAGGFTHADFPYIYSHQGQDIERGVPEFKYHRKRLFKRDACTWKGFIHEHPAVSGKGCKYNEPVWHHYRDGTGRMNTERNLRIFEKRLKEMDGDTLARYTFYYAKELTYNQKYDEAIKQFEKYLPISNLVPEKARAMYELGVLYKMRGDLTTAADYANKCLEIEPNNPDAHVLLAQVMYDKKRWGLCHIYAMKAFLADEEQMAFFDYIPNRTWKPLELMAWSRHQQGQHQDALAYAYEAYKHNKRSEHLKSVVNKFFWLVDNPKQQPLEVQEVAADYLVKPTVAKAEEHLKDCKVVIDVGGYLGSFTDAVLRRSPDATIHVFEPKKEYAEHIEQRFKDRPNVHVHNYALTDTPTNKSTAYLRDHKERLGITTLETVPGGEYNEAETVRTRAFDEYRASSGELRGVAEHGVDLVKIDVEGHEAQVLAGMSKLIEEYKPVLVVENGWADTAESQHFVCRAYDKLFALGYEEFQYDTTERVDYVFVHTSARE